VTHRILVILIVLAVVAVTPLAADRPDLSLRSIAAAARDRTLSRAAIGQGPAAVLAEVVGIETFPVACMTPLLAHQAPAETTPFSPGALLQAKALLTTPPASAARRSFTSEDGGFVISFPARSGAAGLMAADRDGDGLPDLVNRVAEILMASRSHLGDLGYPDPVPVDGSLEVHLLRLGRGVEGYVARPTPPPGVMASPGRASFVILDTALDGERVGPAVMHQMAHLSLAYLAPAPAATWWTEATATFLSFAATGDVGGLTVGLEARQRAVGRGLRSDDLLLMQGTVLWPLFLTERTGDPAVVRRIWERLAGEGLDPLQAADRVLQEMAGVSLADALREYAAWNLFTGERDDGLHYSFGRAFPAADLTLVGPGLPLVLGPVEPIEGMGSIAFRLPSDGGVGALDMTLLAEGGDAGADLLVFYREQGARPVLVPIALEADGRGQISVPWDDAVEAWLILRNTAVMTDEAARFEVRASLDPFAPFDLASFTAEGAGASISLAWTTASEKGLLGWNVYRARRPTGPFLRLNDIAIPAYGDGTEETGYIFVDGAVRGDRRYYYLIEGLTQSGLTRRSHLASARTPPRH
jgi:hypothetical protein